LRRNIGAVMQEVWLMTGTVRENIALGSYQPSDARVVEVATVSGVHDFISTHPQGYQLKLGERGEGLSGGQRQAITIARALVGHPPILLLDEPTSAMDINAERQLIERLKSELGGTTLVVITHKATLLELVDRVIVLDQGKVVADGPRDKVLGGGQGAGVPGSTPAPAASPAPAGATSARGSRPGRPFGGQSASSGALQVVVPSVPPNHASPASADAQQDSEPSGGPGSPASSSRAG
jgi:ATP-binding cassette subfamily C protein LapB